MTSNEQSIAAATAPANPSALPAAGSRLDSAAATRLLRAHWVFLLVLAAFALATAVVPMMTPIAISDDWTYARSAQILLAEGRLTVFPVVVATAVVPIAWGGPLRSRLRPHAGRLPPLDGRPHRARRPGTLRSLP